MRGYKAVNPDMTCRGFKYEVGKTYRTDEAIGLCKNGFHFCKQISEPFGYYDKDSRLFEVEASGEIIDGDDKCVCSEIRLISEITGRSKTIAMYGDGYGDGNGYGYGNGNGYGYGVGYGDGDGNGYGNGYGYGNGNGYGYGYGDGDGNGYGYGAGYGDGDGDGNGYGVGYGDGYGNGKNIQRILTITEVEK